MSDLPAFLDSARPDVPDLAVPRGITPFYLPQKPVRGRLIRLGPLANTLLARHDHPEPVSILLGEALALTASLASALKFSGSFSLQAKGDGPVSMLVVDCTDAGALRGYGRVNLETLAQLPPNTEITARMLLGNGYLAFTVAQGLDREPQQGIVALSGDSLAAMAEHYFETSEQLACRVYLAAGNTENGWRASASSRKPGAPPASWPTPSPRPNCWTTPCCRNASSTACSTARASPSTNPAPSPMAAAARAPAWPISWRVSRRTISTTWQSAATL
jgi:molecular chaperone Hsp33